MAIKERETKFIRVLPDWHVVSLELAHAEMPRVQITHKFFISPKQSVYRPAMQWEKPTLVIDSNVLPAEHHIRLVRITSKPLCSLVLKKLRRQNNLMRKR